MNFLERKNFVQEVVLLLTQLASIKRRKKDQLKKIQTLFVKMSYIILNTVYELIIFLPGWPFIIESSNIMEF